MKVIQLLCWLPPWGGAIRRIVKRLFIADKLRFTIYEFILHFALCILHLIIAWWHYLGLNLKLSDIGLGVRNHHDILGLHSAAAAGIERDFYRSALAGTNGGFGVGWDRATARGADIGDHKVGLAGIGESKFIRYRFSLDDLPEIMFLYFKCDGREGGKIGLAIRRVRVGHYIPGKGLSVFARALFASGDRNDGKDDGNERQYPGFHISIKKMCKDNHFSNFALYEDLPYWLYGKR
jgi:hypothetical protein